MSPKSIRTNALSLIRVWNEARVAVYGVMQRRLPILVQNWIGGSRLTEPVRRLLLWPKGSRTLVESKINFQGRRFRFAAPVKVASTVRRIGGIENGLCRLVLQECQPGAVTLDVGANYGFVSLVMANAVGDSGHVHAFEADPKIFEALASNININNLNARCSVVHGFVGNVADEHHRMTIDDYVDKYGIERLDFIKIDVDGPDFQVLEGARNSLTHFHPVVAIEMTGDQSRILELLRELGYQCSDMSGGEVDPNNWPPNVLAAVGRRLRVPLRTSIH